MGWIIAAIIAIVFVQVMDLRDMVDTVKRIRKLEEEHDHLADKGGKAIKSIQKSTDGVVQSAERVIASADEMTNAFRELVQEVNDGEQQSDSTVEEDAGA